MCGTGEPVSRRGVRTAATTCPSMCRVLTSLRGAQRRHRTRSPPSDTPIFSEWDPGRGSVHGEVWRSVGRRVEWTPPVYWGRSLSRHLRQPLPPQPTSLRLPGLHRPLPLPRRLNLLTLQRDPREDLHRPHPLLQEVPRLEPQEPHPQIDHPGVELEYPKEHHERRPSPVSDSGSSGEEQGVGGDGWGLRLVGENPEFNVESK